MIDSVQKGAERLSGLVNRRVKEWRDQAKERNRFLLGKLVIPQNLYEYLVQNFKSRESKRMIRIFQSNIANILDEKLHPNPAPGLKRRNPFIEEHWKKPIPHIL